MKSSNLYVITGPSGTGKGTLLNEIIKMRKDVFLSISATTRMPRDGEKHGVNYYFLTHELFEEHIKNDDFLEYAKYVDNYYGTLEAPVNEKLKEGFDVVLEIEVQGAMKVKEKRPDAIMIFIAPPSFEELERRLTSRGTESSEKILKRLKTAEYELTQKHEFHHVLVNDDLKESVKKLSQIFENNAKTLK